MKNLKSREIINNKLFIYQEVEKQGEIISQETKEITDLTEAQVEQVIKQIVAVDENDEFTSAEQILNTDEYKNLLKTSDLVPITELETVVEEFLLKLEGGGTVDIDLNYKEVATIYSEETKVSERFTKDEILELTRPFNDKLSEFMQAHPKYYLSGEGKIMINGKESNVLPEGVEEKQLVGIERVKNDFKNLQVDSAEELYQIIQNSYKEKNPGVANFDFTLDDAKNLFSYKENGKSSKKGSGEYKLDTINEERESISREVQEQQKLLARANAALAGTLNQNGGVDGQDGYATIQARRQLVAKINERKLNSSKFKNVTENSQEINVQVEKKEIDERVSHYGGYDEVFIFADSSLSMKGDVEEYAKLMEENNVGVGTNFAFGTFEKKGEMVINSILGEDKGDFNAVVDSMKNMKVGGSTERAVDSIAKMLKKDEIFSKNRESQEQPKRLVEIFTDESIQMPGNNKLEKLEELKVLADGKNAEVVFVFSSKEDGSKMERVKLDVLINRRKTSGNKSLSISNLVDFRDNYHYEEEGDLYVRNTKKQTGDPLLASR